MFLAAALHRSSLSFARALSLSFLFCLPLPSSRALCVRELSRRPRWFIYKERTSTMSGGFFRVRVLFFSVAVLFVIFGFPVGENER